MNDLIKKPEEQINAMSHLLAGTQAGESQAWIELNQVLTEMKISVAQDELRVAGHLEEARKILNLKGKEKEPESISAVGLSISMQEYNKGLQKIQEDIIEELYHEIQKRRKLPTYSPPHEL